MFGEDGVKISTMGERQLCAALGRKEFREKYIAEKIKNWANDISELRDSKGRATTSLFSVQCRHQPMMKVCATDY